MVETKAKYLRTYREKRGMKISYSVYEYKGYEYMIQKTGISHIDQSSHQMNQSHIDNIIKNKELKNYTGKGFEDDLKEFFELIKEDSKKWLKQN